jgi:alpha-tubulin suppressor-like RCC1 family protein
MTVTINKADLITRVNNILSGLNLSTANSTRIALFFKVADNIDIGTIALQDELISRLENVSSSTQLEELLMLIVATSMFEENRYIVVPDLATLEAITEISPGSIYFVEDEQLPYIKKENGTWTLIDPSLHPDPPLENAYAWGNNAYGRLGDNSTTERSSPVSVVGGFTDWISASAGNNFSLGVRANGTLWAWGYNGRGILGDNTVTSRSSPVSVVGGFTDWIEASAGGIHGVAVRANGTLWSWGRNTHGVIGDNTSQTLSRSSPVSVVGGFTDWISASAGSNHIIGVRANGSLWSWGSNGYGQLGTNNTTDRSSPVSVVGGFTDWISANAGSFQSLSIRANGTLWAWGRNNVGQLGDNSLANRSSPVSVVGGFTDWIQASTGWQHSVGIRANGTLWAWGDNTSGQLGDNTVTNKSSPISVIGGFTDWIQANAANGFAFHSLGIRANGTLWAWGNNGNGRLGDNTTDNRSSPVIVIGGFTDWIQANAGRDYSLGIRGG